MGVVDGRVDRMLVSMAEDDFDAVLEMQRYGVTANAISPIAATRMLASIGRAADFEAEPIGEGSNGHSADVSATKEPKQEASGRGGRTFPPNLVAEWDRLDPANASPVVAWLCSEESGWLSGAVLRIDGNTVRRVNGWRSRAATRRSPDRRSMPPNWASGYASSTAPRRSVSAADVRGSLHVR